MITTCPTEVVGLPAGADVELHPMRASDAGALLEFHAGLSDDTTYRRFFSVHPKLSQRELDHFTHVDHVDREALVATSDGRIVAIGRYDRRPGADEAEVAFVVADAWQYQGLGTLLLARLAELARTRGIRRLTAETLAVNGAMLHVFRRSGLPMGTTCSDGVVHVALELAS